MTPTLTHWLAAAMAASTISAQSQEFDIHPSLSSPRPLVTADGAAIVSSDDFAAPTLADLNGDGLLDLLVGDFGTRHGAFVAPSSMASDPAMNGNAGQVRVFLGQAGDEGAFQFGRANWASTRDGQVQSPTW